MVRLQTRSLVLWSLAMSGVGAYSAWAQPAVSTYNVTHQYWFNAGALPPISRLNYAVSTRAFEPAPGWDARGAIGQWNILGQGNFSLQRRAGTDRAAPGFLDAGATAGVNANIQNWGAGFYHATMNSFGTAHARFSPPNRAFANSTLSTTIFAPRSWAFGRLRWTPIIFDTVSGSATIDNPVRIWNGDPIVFEVFDSVGNLMVIDSFFDVWTELDGSLSWDANGLQTGALSNMTLRIDIPTSPFMDLSGLLDVRVESGLVTQSTATGMFAGVGLPGVGTDVSGGLFLPTLTNDFEFNYDFTSLADADSFVIHLSGGGLTDIVPSPSCVSLLTLGAIFSARRRR